MQARYYDPATQQFLTRDPAEERTQQPYTYAAANPVNLVDRTGAEPQLPLEPIEQSNGKWVQPTLPGFWGLLRGVGQAINDAAILVA